MADLLRLPQDLKCNRRIDAPAIPVNQKLAEDYYGRFYRSALTPVLRHLERALVKWAQRKYKRLRRHATNAAHWLGRVARRDPNLLVLWQIGIRPATGS